MIQGLDLFLRVGHALWGGHSGRACRSGRKKRAGAPGHRGDGVVPRMVQKWGIQEYRRRQKSRHLANIQLWLREPGSQGALVTAPTGWDRAPA